MPGAEAHINVQSQDEIQMMIDYFTDITPANSDDGLCRDSSFLQMKRKPNPIICQIREITITIPNHQRIPIPIGRFKLHYYRATMAIDNRYDGEVVDRAMNVERGR